MGLGKYILWPRTPIKSLVALGEKPRPTVYPPPSPALCCHMNTKNVGMWGRELFTKVQVLLSLAPDHVIALCALTQLLGDQQFKTLLVLDRRSSKQNRLSTWLLQ